MERKMKSLKPLDVLDALNQKKVRLFSPEEFRRVFSISLRAAQEFIKDHKTDLFVKLKNGLYALRSSLPSETEIANRLYAPSYLSLEYALAHYRMIPETVYAVTSATTRTTRAFEAGGRAYEYSRIKRQAFTGYRNLKTDAGVILSAEPEKALADYLYFVDLRLKSLNERLYLKKKVNGWKVMLYVDLFERESLRGLAEKIL
jgi:predicted transcriptional regulator of viral defense system